MIHTHNLVDLKPKTTKNYITIILLYFIIMFQGEDINYGALSSTGTCIINCAPPEINVIVMAKALFDCLSNCQPDITINAASQSTA